MDRLRSNSVKVITKARYVIKSLKSTEDKLNGFVFRNSPKYTKEKLNVFVDINNPKIFHRSLSNEEMEILHTFSRQLSDTREMIKIQSNKLEKSRYNEKHITMENEKVLDDIVNRLAEIGDEIDQKLKKDESFLSQTKNLVNKLYIKLFQ